MQMALIFFIDKQDASTEEAEHLILLAAAPVWWCVQQPHCIIHALGQVTKASSEL